MRVLKENHRGPSTIFALTLIPLSGFATDIYLPSLPSMAQDLQVSMAAVQLSLVLFMFSTGMSQLFIGTILDSFGRFKISSTALAIFSITSFIIAMVPNIYLIYVLRVAQGLCIALIVVAKRAYFVDLYTGDKLKGYVSLFAIIWACAPILAPFIGGYLQNLFGWQSNFYFLGILSAGFLVLELAFSGESIKHFHPFKLRPIINTYIDMGRSGDFTLGLLIIGVCFGIVVTYSLSSPFIIEKVLGYSAIITGYSSLLSGLAIMSGGIIAKSLIKVDLRTKVVSGLVIQSVFILAMIFSASWANNIFTLICFTICIHASGGFVFNILFGYCLSRFTKNAGVAAGITGGAMYMISSVFSYSFANLFAIKNQFQLGLANATLAGLMIILFLFFERFRNKTGNDQRS